ncbi:MAG TPA: STAS domain-containing protein [Solirubrobacteraceae bacterium]|nr:STAS domain-containing protein [Solirubrobacteraceae bacterium]
MSAHNRFRVGARHGRDRLILELQGELDMASAHLLDETLAGASPKDSCEAVVLDLAGVQFADSTGLKAIFRARKTVLDQGLRFAVTESSPQVQRLLKLTRLDEHLETIEAPESELG